MSGEMANQAPSPLDRVRSPRDLRGMSDAELRNVSDAVRAELIDVVSTTGGHLGSSLGVVELTVAIHAVFDTPLDRLIWDVGHQCYPHKILTERREKMRTIRQEGGVSGFTRRAESVYDPFGAAHSSTSISAGLGFAAARDLGGDPGDVICVIGDGALSAGLAYEAMNNAGAAGRRLFVILNDNNMSIAPPSGAMANHLTDLRQGAAAVGATFFETLGFAYRGPVDGHDMTALLGALREARAENEGPVLIHAVTRKGAGFEAAEAAADKYHGVSKFDVVSGRQHKTAPAAPSYTKVFGDALTGEAERDPRIVAITAAMPGGAGVDGFAKRFPKRCFDVGIAEQHAVTYAAGLAASGMKPFCAIYSTFLQRAFDQVVHDVAIQGLPVRFAIDRAGLVGVDGPTHAGSFDIACLANLPGFTVMAASDEAELVHMVATAAAHEAGPIAFRYPRGEGRGVELPERGAPLEIGRGSVVKEGRKVALLSFGARLEECLLAARELDAKGLSTTVADARFAKPLDLALLNDLAANHAALVTIEEGSTGGFGALALHALAEAGRLSGRVGVRTMTLPDRFVAQASPQRMYEAAGLTARDIAAKALSALEDGMTYPADADAPIGPVAAARLTRAQPAFGSQ